MFPGVRVKPELELSAEMSHSDNSDSCEAETSKQIPGDLGPEETGKDSSPHCPGPEGVFSNVSPPFCLNNQAFNVSASLKAYADRMQADYFRYRLAKESAENFYSRLAVFQNTFNPLRYYLNPFALRQFGPPGPGPGPGSQVSPPGVDLSLKPTLATNINSKQPGNLQHQHQHQGFEEVSAKKRQTEDSDSGSCGEKRQKLSLKRKVLKKCAGNDETSSPVSGTVIRQLAEGESLPEIRKGKIQCPLSCSISSQLDGIFVQRLGKARTKGFL